MTSVVRLRWINLSGSLLFTVYGPLVTAYPVARLNFRLARINSCASPGFTAGEIDR